MPNKKPDPSRSMERNFHWKGGRCIDHEGRVILKMPGHPLANHLGYVYEHRLIASLAIGRWLHPYEYVWHRDHDLGNNTPENLVVVITKGKKYRAVHHETQS